MKKFFVTSLGRLRVLAFLEGISLLLLVGVAMPLKYAYDDPAWSYALGRIHGVLFLLFVFNTISVGIAHNWKFSETTWKVLVASFIPFGTFYIDARILRPLQKETKNAD